MKNRRVTPFQERVYAATRRVPPGRVTTYGEIARHLGTGCSRAVGQALRKNPFAPEVPCHRVIRSDLAIGGFGGATGGGRIAKKLRLLRDEGIVFRNGKLADASQVFRFSRSGRCGA